MHKITANFMINREFNNFTVCNYKGSWRAFVYNFCAFNDISFFFGK